MYRVGVVVLVSTLVCAGCATAPGPKATVGSLGGAASGVLLAGTVSGNDPMAMAAGGILGLLAGFAIGDRLDAADQARHARLTHEVLETAPDYRPGTWKNPNTGHSGRVVVTRTVQHDAGQPCREFQTTIYVGGEAKQGYGTACRDASGAWKIQ